MSDNRIIHGIDSQTVLNVCQFTLKAGEIVIRHPTTIHEVLVMGMKFQYTGEKMGGEIVFEKRRGWPFDQTTKGRENRLHHRNPEFSRHTLTGDDWMVWIDYETAAKVGSYGRRFEPEHELEEKIKECVQWGESYYKYIGHKFSGDVDNFQKQMIVAKLIGDDHEVWEQIANAN
jgi:hypothetical protein